MTGARLWLSQRPQEPMPQQQLRQSLRQAFKLQPTQPQLRQSKPGPMSQVPNRQPQYRQTPRPVLPVTMAQVQLLRLFSHDLLSPQLPCRTTHPAAGAGTLHRRDDVSDKQQCKQGDCFRQKTHNMQPLF